MNTLYRHPDGMGEIAFDAATFRLFLANETEALSAWAYIGPDGLRELADKLLALADATGARQ